MIYRIATGVRCAGNVVIGGSPLRLFRLTAHGREIFERIAVGEEAPPSRLVDSLLDAGAIHPIAPVHGRFGPDDVTIVVPTLGPPAHRPTGAIVVDDGSSPPVADADLRLDDNRGPAAARNAGLALVTTPLVAFVDADVEVPDDWLERLLGHFDDERVALVAPRVRSRPVRGRLGSWERRHSPLDLGAEPARIRAGTRVSYVPAAALICRTDALRAIGGFDETLRFGEDVDACWRLDNAGWRCRYEPSVGVEHEPRPSWPRWARQRIGYGTSAAPLSRRHPGALAPLRASGWSVAAWFAAAAGHPLAALGIVGGTGAALVRKLPELAPRDSFGLATRGTAHVGLQLATAVRRAWWPVLAIAAVRSKVARRSLLLAGLAAAHPLRLADDVAYSVGVWRGMVAERTAAPLVPDLTSWPGRTRPVTTRREPLRSTE